MPVGNDGRASRRPMPRQLDMSSWGMDSTSSARDGDRFQSTSGSTGAGDLSYAKTREPPSRLDTFGDYRSHRSITSDESLQLERRASRTSEIEASSFSSDRSTSRGSSTLNPSSRGFPRGGSPSSTHGSDRGSRHDNQREIEDTSRAGRYESSTWNRRDEPWRSDRPSRSSSRPTREHDDSHYTASSGYAGAAGSFSSRTLFDSRRSDNRLQSNLSEGKADSIREAESPVRSHTINSTRTSRHHENESTHNTPELRTSSLVASFENQDEPPSPTNSETSNPPSSPDSDHDSIAQQIRDRYPKPSIPSPVSSDRSTAKVIRASSPCSSVATSRSSASRASTSTAKQLDRLQVPAQSAMSDLREDLYAFRKQMREVFIRVEDVVDVHRSLFKSDPSTGSPVWNEDLQQEAEQLATTAFEQLADLRQHFARLAKDFERSEPPTDGWTERSRRQKHQPVATAFSALRTQPQRRTSVDDEAASSKGSEVPEDVASNNSEDEDEVPTHRGSQERCNSSQDDNGDAPSDSLADSVRSSASTFLSAQLPSRWRSDRADSESVATSDISARMRSSSFTSIASTSIPEQCSKPSDAVDTDSIFQDFDKRMEEIRSSLNAIAGGKKPRVAAPTERNFTTRSATKDAPRAKATLREASRISRRLGKDADATDSERSRSGGREAEMRQLLQQLNQLSTDNDD